MLFIKDARRVKAGISRTGFLAKLFAETADHKKFVVDSKVFETSKQAFQWLLNRVGLIMFHNEIKDVQNFDLLIIDNQGTIESFVVNVKE